MKKTIITLFALIFLAPFGAHAAGFNLSPATGTYAPGRTFTVNVYVNPASGEHLTTAKLSSLFTTSTMEYVSFKQATGWMSLVQPGYDEANNGTGVLIKTGGYPAKVSSRTLFGIVTFKVKKAGVGTLSIASSSLLLDAKNTNTFTATGPAIYTFSTPVVAKKVIKKKVIKQKPVVVVATPKKTVQKKAETVAVATTTTAATSEATTTKQNSQVAAAAAATTGKKGNWWWLYALLALILGGIGGFTWWKRK